jgi:hypothetical protein
MNEEGATSDRDPCDRLAIGHEQDGAIVDDDLHVAFVVLDA